jgi:hypothetical protein
MSTGGECVAAGGTVDRLYTRTNWQARTGEWWQTAQYSERGAAYELTGWLHNVAPTVRSLFMVLSAAAPLRTVPPAALARESIDLPPRVAIEAFVGRSDCPLRQIVAAVKLQGQDAESHASPYHHVPCVVLLESARSTRRVLPYY